MKRNVSFFVVFVLLFCMALPVFAEVNDRDKTVKLAAEITEQTMRVGAGADTFWTGVVMGGVDAITLLVVYNLFEDKQGKEMTIAYITTGGVGLASVICMIWGGIEWAVAAGRLDDLKKAEKDVTLVPYLDPLAQNSVELGLGLNLKL